MFKKIVLTLAMLLCVTSTAMAQKTIVFAVDATWPPMEFMNSDKQIVGYSIDYMTAAAKGRWFHPGI